MSATEAQIRDLANTIALQSDALAQGKIDPSTLYAHIQKIAENVRTLEVWTSHLKPQPVSQNRVIAVAAVNAVEAPGYCFGCGRTYRGAPGLRAHQSRFGVALGCRGN